MLSKTLTFFSTLFFISFFAFADAKKNSEDDKIDIGGMIMHHILDDYGYEIMEGVVIPLPVILYSKETGLDIFSSSKLFDKGHIALSEGYKGYYYVYGDDGKYFPALGIGFLSGKSKDLSFYGNCHIGKIISISIGVAYEIDVNYF